MAVSRGYHRLVRWLLVFAVISFLVAVGGAEALSAATSRPVSWAQAQRLLQDCRVKALEQTHSRLGTLKLRHGGRGVTRGPRIGDLLRILYRPPPAWAHPTVADRAP